MPSNKRIGLDGHSQFSSGKNQKSEIFSVTRAASIIQFNERLAYQGQELPSGVAIMNPFQENPAALEMSRRFYEKFYNDEQPRHLILGINPGRLGAGATGIPFTDTKRYLQTMGEVASIGRETHEPSSVFVYEVIHAYGGAQAFYADFYINSVCPLGFTITKDGRPPVNYNYYDDKALERAVTPFIIWNLREQARISGCHTRVVCMGTGKNFAFLKKLNDQVKVFAEVVAIEHPRYIMQYKAKQMTAYIDQWLAVLSKK